MSSDKGKANKENKEYHLDLSKDNEFLHLPAGDYEIAVCGEVEVDAREDNWDDFNREDKFSQQLKTYLEKQAPKK